MEEKAARIAERCRWRFNGGCERMRTERPEFECGEEIIVCCSPSPQPSPPRRGRPSLRAWKARTLHDTSPLPSPHWRNNLTNCEDAPTFQVGGECFSLSPGERVGVRASVLQTFLAAILLGLLAGCAVGPDYHRPSALTANPMPAAFGDAAITNLGNWKTAEPSAHLPRGAWWELYDDPELNRLESLAATNNQELAVALA